MDSNISHGVAETANLANSIVQSNRFKERDARKADSVVRSDAVYFSPVIRIDPDTQTAIIQYRDSSTGQITNEYPTPRQMDSYKHSAETTPPPQAAPAPKAEPKVEKKAEKPIEHVDSHV